LAKKVLTYWQQPITPAQLSYQTGLETKQCTDLVRNLSQKGLFHCINPEARIGRLYWLTKTGCTFQNRIRKEQKLPFLNHPLPSINWPLYGQLCFSHRSAVIKTLSIPLQPAEIKRKLRIEQPQVHINADNVRDIIRFFKFQNIVQPIYSRRKAYPKYELTQMGKQFRELLIRAEVKIRN
tara:strand:- start:3424 stop:3963 length:540 start_codon:yes stop_codon:yes gene_type:complete